MGWNFSGSRATRREVSSEVEKPEDAFAARLAMLGATEAEIGQVLDSWRAEGRPDGGVYELDDAALRDMIVDARAEFYLHTHAPTDDAEALRAAAWEAVKGTVEQVREWVGADVDRVIVALAAERDRPHPRSTLVAWLQAMIPTGEDDEG